MSAKSVPSPTAIDRLEHVARMERARGSTAAMRSDPTARFEKARLERERREREAHARSQSGYSSREGGGVAAVFGGGTQTSNDRIRQRQSSRSPSPSPSAPAPSGILKRPGSRSKSPDPRVRFSEELGPGPVCDSGSRGDIHSLGGFAEAHDAHTHDTYVQDFSAGVKASAMPQSSSGSRLGKAREAADSWGGNSLEDVLDDSPRPHPDDRNRVPPRSTGRLESVPRSRKGRDAVDSWGSSSLEDVLGGSKESSKQHVNVHRHMSSPESTGRFESAPRRGRHRDAADSWGGSSLEDVLGGGKGSQRHHLESTAHVHSHRSSAKTEAAVRPGQRAVAQLVPETDEERQEPACELTMHATPEELTEKCLDIFRHFDTNRNGMIEREELAAVLKELNPEEFCCADYPAADILFDQIDRDGSGLIDFEEFIPWVMASDDLPTMVDAMMPEHVHEQGGVRDSLREMAHSLQRRIQKVRVEKLAAVKAEDFDAAKAAKQHEQGLLAELISLQSRLLDELDFNGRALSAEVEDGTAEEQRLLAELDSLQSLLEDSEPLGITMSKEPAHNHHGIGRGTANFGYDGLMATSEAASNTGREAMPSAGRAARRANADSWAGVSLEDALGPKKEVKHRYGKSSSQEESDPYAGVARHLPARRVEVNFEGASLADVMAQGRHARLDERHAGAHELPSSEYAFAEKPAAIVESDPWAGVSLGEVLGSRPELTSRKAAAHVSTNFGSAGRLEAAGGSSSCQKTSAEIIDWLKTLPESHVPERAREGIIECVESQGLTGDSFTEFVQKIDPSICGPKPAMKLKAAWKNVLAEAAAMEVCRTKADDAANNGKKAEAIHIAC